MGLFRKFFGMGDPGRLPEFICRSGRLRREPDRGHLRSEESGKATTVLKVAYQQRARQCVRLAPRSLPPGKQAIWFDGSSLAAAVRPSREEPPIRSHREVIVEPSGNGANGGVLAWIM
jgi:hypothetical protein